MKKKIVVLGGGNGVAVALCALKSFVEYIEINAILNTADSGGSSGELRKVFGALPPGDIMRAVLALSKYDYHILRTLFYKTRFLDAGKLTGHNLGNLFLVFAAQYAGDFSLALRALEQAVEAVGRVYSVTTIPVDLGVTLSNGSHIFSEGAIDRPQYDRGLRIVQAWLRAPVPATSDVLTLIQEADYILIGPGSLYTSLVPTLLPSGIKEAIAKSSAKLWYILSRGLETNAETGPEKLSDFVHELEQYLPRSLDLVLYNNRVLDERQAKAYQEKSWKVIEHNVANLTNRRVLGADFEDEAGGHNADKLSVVLRQLLHIK